MASEVTTGMRAARREMEAEARRIVDAARARGVVLRLFGGLAVRAHCELAYVCDRDHSDIDLIGLGRQVKAILAIFEELGFRENIHVRTTTSYHQLQFYRPCDHPDTERGFLLHPDDHVDVFLDAFHMDHVVQLRERLEIEDYTLPLGDVLLTKLQTVHMDERDERDVISLLAQTPLRVPTDLLGERGSIDVAYIAGLCARDWGLWHDVLAGIARVRAVVGSRDDLGPGLVERVREALDRLEAAIAAEPKTFRWRLREKVGTRAKWHEDVEEQDAPEHGPPVPSAAAGRPRAV